MRVFTSAYPTTVTGAYSEKKTEGMERAAEELHGAMSQYVQAGATEGIDTVEDRQLVASAFDAALGREQSQKRQGEGERSISLDFQKCSADSIMSIPKPLVQAFVKLVKGVDHQITEMRLPPRLDYLPDLAEELPDLKKIAVEGFKGSRLYAQNLAPSVEIHLDRPAEPVATLHLVSRGDAKFWVDGVPVTPVVDRKSEEDNFRLALYDYVDKPTQATGDFSTHRNYVAEHLKFSLQRMSEDSSLPLDFGSQASAMAIKNIPSSLIQAFKNALPTPVTKIVLPSESKDAKNYPEWIAGALPDLSAINFHESAKVPS